MNRNKMPTMIGIYGIFNIHLPQIELLFYLSTLKLISLVVVAVTVGSY